MGTEVQSKMYLPGPGYYTFRDVDDKVVNGSLNLRHESRTSNNGQYMFLTSPSMEGYFGYDKQHVRQTILSHEVIFKHQVHELHRLYKRQTDLMDELKFGKLCKVKTPVEMQQANLFSSRFTSKDAKSMPYYSSVPPVTFTHSTPPIRPMKEDINLNSSVCIQNGVRLDDCGSFEYRSKKLHRRLFDLEVPADTYIDEDVQRDITHRREVNLFRGRDVNFDGDHQPPLWNCKLANLNEAVKVGGSSSSVPVGVLGNVNFCKGPVTRQDSFVNSSSNLQFLSKKASIVNAQNGRDGGLERNNLHFNFESDKTKCNNSVVHAGCHASNSSALFGSSQIEPMKAHKPVNMTPSDRSKMIFGVDIGNDKTVLHSHKPDPIGSNISSSQEHETNSSQKLISRNLESTDAQINAKKLHDGLPWLKKPICRPDTSNEKVGSEMNDCPSIGKILGVPIFATLPQSKPSSFSSIIGDHSKKIESSNNDFALDSVVVTSTGQLEVVDDIEENELNSHDAKIRHQIDLNMCLNEEESPLVVEPELVVSQEGFERIAADAIVAISSYRDPTNKTSSPLSQSPRFESLHWFADVISSYSHDNHKVDEAVSTGKNNCNSCEKRVARQFDYFEFMTLRLTETKLDECHHKPEALEKIPKDEEKLPKRAQRGKSRRGRQRKDFQRDILPSISSLSRQEVSEDFHIIEGIIKTTGGTWESSFRKRNGKGSSRGRRCSGSGKSVHIPIVSTVCPPQNQDDNPNETGLGEQRLTGWGKRTRRLSRNRCPIIKSPVLVK